MSSEGGGETLGCCGVFIAVKSTVMARSGKQRREGDTPRVQAPLDTKKSLWKRILIGVYTNDNANVITFDVASFVL